MNKTTMTLQNEDWTRAEIVAAWADDETLTSEQLVECADTELAWIINNLNQGELSGWTYDAGTGAFWGPARNDAHAQILSLFVEAADYTVEHLDEIRAGI
jgi:hypothetical protein